MKSIRAMVEVLSEDEIQEIHDASLRILEKTGMGMPHTECLKRCKKCGASVDLDTEVMRIPAGVMKDLLSEMKRQIAPPSDPLRRMPLQGSISTQVYVVDYESRARRPGLTDDILKGIALVDALKNIPHANAVCVPSDVDRRISDIHAYLQIYTYAKKPGGTYILTPESAGCILDMAEALGRREWYLLESISPLRFRRETLEMGTLFADRGHHLSIGPMIQGGSTGPVTLAGMCTLLNAEVLGSLFTCHALTGSLPGSYGHGSHSTDPRTLLCSFGSPSQSLLGIATAQMGRFYGLPSSSNSALSDSLLPDFQCGFEKTSSALFACLAGTGGIGCQGIAGADQGFSFEQLVVDDEWLDAYNFIISGFEVSAETIAEELIEQLGIGANFIAEEHTVAHLRESWWSSSLFSRVSWDVWKQAGAGDLLGRSRKKVEQLTAGYRTMQPVLPQGQVEDIRRIAAKAREKLVV